MAEKPEKITSPEQQELTEAEIREALLGYADGLRYLADSRSVASNNPNPTLQSKSFRFLSEAESRAGLDPSADLESARAAAASEHEHWRWYPYLNVARANAAAGRDPIPSLEAAREDTAGVRYKDSVRNMGDILEVAVELQAIDFAKSIAGETDFPEGSYALIAEAEAQAGRFVDAKDTANEIIAIAHRIESFPRAYAGIAEAEAGVGIDSRPSLQIAKEYADHAVIEPYIDDEGQEMQPTPSQLTYGRIGSWIIIAETEAKIELDPGESIKKIRSYINEIRGEYRAVVVAEWQADIAKIEALAGNFTAASNLIGEMSLIEGGRTDKAYEEVAKIAAHKGFLEKAEAMVEKIQEAHSRVLAFASVAKIGKEGGRTRVLLQRAKQEAEQVVDEQLRDDALLKIAHAEAEAAFWDSAKRTAEMVSLERRPELFLIIAEEEIKAGNDARNTIEIAQRYAAERQPQMVTIDDRQEDAARNRFDVSLVRAEAQAGQQLLTRYLSAIKKLSAEQQKELREQAAAAHDENLLRALGAVFPEKSKEI